MVPLSLSELDRHRAEVDDLALAAAGLDRFCSTTPWAVSAAESFVPTGEPWIYLGTEGLVALCARRHGVHRVVEALECGWGLACPLVGADAQGLVDALVEIVGKREQEWDFLALSGLYTGSALLAAVSSALASRYRLGLGPVTRRHVSSLEGGAAGFLARRGRNLRKTLKKAERWASEAGVSFVEHSPSSIDEAEVAFARVLAVEQKSWKGQSEIGLSTDEMRGFYRQMSARLAVCGRLRVSFATLDGEDIGYVLGAVFGDRYRGLQFSFDDRFRPHSLGSWCQWQQIERLTQGGDVASYDLGTGGDYKVGWAEQHEDSVVLVVAKR